MNDKRIPDTDRTSTYGPICPHCEHEHQADEGHYYDRENFTEHDCEKCGKPFPVEVEFETTWTTYVADVLSPEHEARVADLIREREFDDPRHIIRPTPEPERLDTENGDRDLSI